MSKGPGRQQERILKALEDGGEWTTESLRWFLFEKDKNRELSCEGKLPSSWNTSFARAVQGLGEKHRISVQSRALESFQECVKHYPGKTLRADARKLRAKLLPVLQEWILEKGGLKPKYGIEANEIHHLRSLTKETIHQLGREWESLEEQLRPVYGQTSQAAAPSLLGLICKGRSLFNSPHGWSDVSATGSLVVWLNKTARSEALPGELLGNLRAFLDRFIPPKISKVLNFKSYIHELTDVPNHGQCKLRKETINYLHDKCRMVVEGMVGFSEIERKHRLSFHFPYEDKYVYPDALLRLFDHTVFQDFEFLALPE